MALPRSTGSPAGNTDSVKLRNATNLRIISRNDPAVNDIVETSTYAVVYHYDTDAGKWVKQKQEGTLFVLSR